MDFNSLNVKGLLQAGCWKIADERTLVSAATSVTLNTVAGNTAGRYRLFIRHVGGEATGSYTQFKFNSDATEANYGRQHLYGANTATGATRSTGPYIGPNSVVTNHINTCDYLIHSASGYLRTLNGIVATDINGTSVLGVYSHSNDWTNTADELTGITIFADQTNGLGAGTYILLLKEVYPSSLTVGAHNSVSVPTGRLNADCLETISEQTTGADATSISATVDGDTDVILEVEGKIIGGSSAGDIIIQFNSDTTNANYGYQNLYGVNTTLGAARGTAGRSMSPSSGCPANNIFEFRGIIYVKSGFPRTGLFHVSIYGSGTTMTEVSYIATSWNNTGSNITGITFAHTQTNGILAGSWLRVKSLRRKV